MRNKKFFYYIFFSLSFICAHQFCMIIEFSNEIQVVNKYYIYMKSKIRGKVFLFSSLALSLSHLVIVVAKSEIEVLK